MSENNKSKGFAVGAAIGAVAGVVAGILLAPKSGKETRKDIKDAASKLAVRFEKEAKNLQSELSELIDKAEQKIKKTGKSVTAKSNEAVKQAKHARDTLATLAKSIKVGKADDKDLDKALANAREAISSLKTYIKK